MLPVVDSWRIAEVVESTDVAGLSAPTAELGVSERSDAQASYLYSVLLPAVTRLALPAFNRSAALHFFFMQDIHFPGAITGNQEFAIDTPRTSDVQQLA